jgi:hypothetical protein
MIRQKVSSHLRSVPGRKQKVRVKSYERTVPKKKSTTKKKSGQTKIGAYGRRVLKATYRQTGTSSTARDKKRKAMQPGKRRSASGRIYYETRKNRSDLRGSRV